MKADERPEEGWREAFAALHREVAERSMVRTHQMLRWVLGIVGFSTLVLAGGILHVRMELGVNSRSLRQIEVLQRADAENLRVALQIAQQRHDLLVAQLTRVQDIIDEHRNLPVKKGDP